MKRFFILVLLPAIVLAHGGSFRGPNGGVPPGQREPSDPEPPPPPPSEPGTPGGPITPTPTPGDTTPPDYGTPSPDSAPQPTPDPGQGRGKARATTAPLTFESWRFWWGYNNDDILNLKAHIFANRTATSNPLYYASRTDEQNRQPVERATQRAIEHQIHPALWASINRLTEHQDVHGGAIIAKAKSGRSTDVAAFYDILFNRYRNTQNRKMDFGLQATESAALALGLLPELDQKSKEAVRRACLEAIADDSLRTRERCWAAVSLGLQRDREAIPAMIELLHKKHRYPDGNVPAGILAGLGLIGDPIVLDDLIEAFVDGNLYGRDIRNNDRIRAFVGYAITKIGDPQALPAILKILSSRSFGRVVKRSAAIAAGVLGARADDELKDQAVKVLLKSVRRTAKDPSTENFAIIALSQIGTPRALHALMEIGERGRYGQRPFAALGLGTYVWYQRQADAAIDHDMQKRIVDTLAKLSQKYKDADTKAAFMLARGLVKDAAASDELVKIVAKRGRNPVLRGYCCVALGLLGDARNDVKDALRLALSERSSKDLRRDAATGLGLLHDRAVVKTLLQELRKARSFAVQGQLITAIGTVGDAKAIAPLIHLLEDKGQPAQTRAMAAVGLGMIGDLRTIPALSRISKNYNYRASVTDMDELLFIL